MDLTEFQAATLQFAKYPAGHLSIPYCNLGAVGEAGEICNKVKKVIRDDAGVLTPERRADLIEELGDVLWYIARRADHDECDIGLWVQGSHGSVDLTDASLKLAKCCTDLVDYQGYQIELFIHDCLDAVADLADLLGTSIEDVAAVNIAKLQGRLDRGTLLGAGDQR